MTLASYQPRTIGEIVDATFVLYRANFLTVVTIALLVIAPPALIKAITPAELQRVVDLIGNLLIPIGQGAIAAVVAAAVEREVRLDFRDALLSTAGLRGSLIGVQIASGLLVFIGLILLVVPGFIALAWTAVGVPVVMVERLGYSKAIERSRALARGRWGHVLGTLILAWGLAILVMIGAGALVGVLGAGERFVDLFVDLLVAVVLPIPAIAMTFLYYDLRVRTESADLDAMISALPAATP